MLTLAITEHQASRTRDISTQPAALPTHHPHELHQPLGTVTLLLPRRAVRKPVSTPADIAGFLTVLSHEAVVVDTLTTLSPLLTTLVFVHTRLVSSVVVL